MNSYSLVDADGDEVGLHGNAAADAGFEDCFEGTNLALRSSDFAHEDGSRLGIADVIDGGLGAEGHQSAENDHVLAGLDSGQEREDGIVPSVSGCSGGRNSGLAREADAR